LGDADGVDIEGERVVTLSHGLTHKSDEEDKRAHLFFGDHTKILDALAKLPFEGGVYLSSGVKKMMGTLLVRGFL
jgi:hypothetical protein